MKFTQVDEREITEKGICVSDVFKTLNDFAECGYRCAKLDSYPHKTAVSCASAFRVAIKRYNRPHIKVMIRKNDVYLINTLID